MKKFTFSLQRLMGYKEQLFDAERTILAGMRSVLLQMENELEELIYQHKTRTLALREKMKHGTTANELELHKTYLRLLEHQAEQKRKQIKMQLQVIDKQMDKVREAKIEISTMEKLKEKKLEEYNYVAAKADEQFIEEYVCTQKSMSPGI